MTPRPFVAAAACLALGASALAQEPGVSLTVYSDPSAASGQPAQPVYNPVTSTWEQPPAGFSIVRERRRVRLDAGRNVHRFADVAARIDGSTVKVRSLTDPALQVVEQDFQFDLASADRILEKHLDREVTAVRGDGSRVSGRLLSFDAGQLVLQGAAGEGITILARGANVSHLRFAELPGGLTTRPTLVWLLHAPAAGEHLLDVAYETAGMSWSADYTAVVSPDESRVDLSAWVTIENRSGATYRDARLKLVAGDVHRAPRQAGQLMAMERSMAAMPAGGTLPGFEEKSFFEYHLYTLGRPTTLADRSLKQIELFPPVAGVPCRKIYVYDGAALLPDWYGGGPNMEQSFGPQSNRKVDVYLEAENRAAHGLGMPLPAGRVRVHKADEADGSLELVGEDRIDHTPKDEKVLLRLGSAFDIVGERRQTAFEVNYDAHWIRESFEMKIRNHKREPVQVRVRERLYRWVNWNMERASHELVKQDARNVYFPVTVPTDGEVVVTYTVKYSW